MASTAQRAAVGTRLPVLEVFASVQGEGLFVGQPQVFVRLAGCPLRCRYCDTPHSWAVRDAGEHAARWSTPFAIACRVAEAEGGVARAVSLTGGEPLVWSAGVPALARLLGMRRLHLETAGAHPAALERVLPAVDHVSLDLKLASDLAEPVAVDVPAGEERVDLDAEPAPRTAAEWRVARRASLSLLAEADAAAKLVLTDASDAAEVEEALHDVAELAPAVPLVVQPATPFGRAAAPSIEAVLAAAEEALALGLAVRVVPQVHRQLGLR